MFTCIDRAYFDEDPDNSTCKIAMNLRRRQHNGVLSLLRPCQQNPPRLSSLRGNQTKIYISSRIVGKRATYQHELGHLLLLPKHFVIVSTMRSVICAVKCLESVCGFSNVSKYNKIFYRSEQRISKYP
ncbi:hypothetical protein V1477_011037 [Vespula maculifrons]|uniref:Uncharacterized protein n=1 Tax=Vespula maculifrons TaxID=7453 RepID=A0ABD2C3N2_VESMC